MGKKRLLAGLTALAFCLFVLFSSAFLIVESNHGCTGVDCQVCTLMRLCAHLLESVAVALTAAAPVWAMVCCGAPCLLRSAATRPARSLVTLKVKLSN